MKLTDLASVHNLAVSFGAVERRSPAAGIDGVTPATYARTLESALPILSRALTAKTWRPGRLLRISVEKAGGGTRKLAIPNVEDRIVIEALRRALEPEIEPILSAAAFAYRPGRSARSAVDAIQRAIAEGAEWVALADIRQFFDCVKIDLVLDRVRELDADPDMVQLLARVLEGHASGDRRGLVQGSSLSPLLSNLTLTRLDRRTLGAGWPLVRYCDNLCISTKTEPLAKEALNFSSAELSRLGLSLKPEASRVARVSEGFVWLGFRLSDRGGCASEAAIAALAERIKRAANGAPEGALESRIQLIVRGWMQYFDTDLPESGRFGELDDLVRRVADQLRARSTRRTDSNERADSSASHGDDECAGVEDEWAPWSRVTPEEEIERSGDDLLHEMDRLAAAGDFAAAEIIRKKADDLIRKPQPSSASDESGRPGSLDDELLDAFIGIFCAGQESFEAAELNSTAAASGAPRPFEPANRPPSPADIEQHLQGRRAIAIRPRLLDGTSTIGVFDIDPASDEAEPAHACVAAISAILQRLGIEYLVEETGGRGIHVWIPVAAPMPAERLAGCLGAIVRTACAASGVRIEALPASDAAVELHGQTMTLPLGRHVESGVRSLLRWGMGSEVSASDLRNLFSGTANAINIVERALGLAPNERTQPRPDARMTDETAPKDASNIDWSKFGKSVERVIDGCAVLRHLSEKAGAVGHLDHGERLSLLYTLGHLGSKGNEAIHTVISQCSNYSVSETARQIQRLSGLPIGCTRLREKHATPELLPLCNCDFEGARQRGGYPTPLLHAGGFKRAWRDVLRGRRQTEQRIRSEGAPGIVAETDPPPQGRATPPPEVAALAETAAPDPETDVPGSSWPAHLRTSGRDKGRSIWIGEQSTSPIRAQKFIVMTAWSR